MKIKVTMTKIKDNPKIYYISLTVLFVFLSILSNNILTKNGLPALKELIDAPFHLARVQGLAGVLQGPISYNNFHHYGLPVNIFYPWLTLWPMYLFYRLSHSLVLSYYLYFILLTFITFWLTYYVAYKINNSKKSALVFSLVYTLAFYRQANILYRHAVGEAIAMTILPLVLYGIYQVIYKQRYVSLALAMALLAYTHILSLLLASILVVVIYGVSLFLKQVNQKTNFTLLKGIICSFLLSLGSLGSIWLFNNYHIINEPMKRYLQQEALNPFDLLQVSINNHLGMRQYGVGIVILCLVLISIVKWKELDLFTKIIFSSGIFFAFCTTTFMPWFYLQNTKLELLQFPWRFMSLATLCLAYVGSIALTKITKYHFSRIIVGLCIVLVVIQISLTASFQPQPGTYQRTLKNDKDFSKVMQKSFNGDADYMSKKAMKKINLLKQQEVTIGEKKVSAKKKYTATEASYQFNLPQKSEVVLPILAYPCLQVKVDKQNAQFKTTESDLVEVNLDKGQHTITVRSFYPQSVIACWLVSGVTLLIITGLSIYRKKKQQEN